MTPDQWEKWGIIRRGHIHELVKYEIAALVTCLDDLYILEICNYGELITVEVRKTAQECADLLASYPVIITYWNIRPQT